MGILGGPLAFWFLNRCYPNGRGVPLASEQAFTGRNPSGSKLIEDFGSGIFSELRDKVILDFGCGSGETAIELARNGARRVVGLDIQEHQLNEARLAAVKAGVSHRCVFASSWDDPVDVILSQDAFEHFESPRDILHVMHGLLKPTGYVLVHFGPLWLHPYGGHLFSVFPWAHLIFTEKALIRWRSDFKPDGARHFHEVAGGLNQMTVKGWERLISDSEFELESYELIPVTHANRLRIYSSLTREVFTAAIKARLVRRRCAAPRLHETEAPLHAAAQEGDRRVVPQRVLTSANRSQRGYR